MLVGPVNPPSYSAPDRRSRPPLPCADQSDPPGYPTGRVLLSAQWNGMFNQSLPVTAWRLFPPRPSYEPAPRNDQPLGARAKSPVSTLALSVLPVTISPSTEVASGRLKSHTPLTDTC